MMLTGKPLVCMLLIVPFVLQPTLVTLMVDAADCPMFTSRLPLYASMTLLQLSWPERVQNVEA